MQRTVLGWAVVALLAAAVASGCLFGKKNPEAASPDKQQAGADEAYEPLSAALCDRAPAVRMAAARALGRIGEDRALLPLVARPGDPDAAVRAAARAALGQLRPKR